MWIYTTRGHLSVVAYLPDDLNRRDGTDGRDLLLVRCRDAADLNQLGDLLIDSWTALDDDYRYKALVEPAAFAAWLAAEAAKIDYASFKTATGLYAPGADPDRFDWYDATWDAGLEYQELREGARR